MIATILEYGKLFYDRFIAGDDEIPTDFFTNGSAEYAYPVSEPVTVDMANDESFVRAVAAYDAVKKYIKQLEGLKNKCRDYITASLKSAEKAVFEGGSVTWKSGKLISKVDHKAKYELAMESLKRRDLDLYDLVYRDVAEHADLYAAEVPAARRLTVSIKKNAIETPSLGELNALASNIEEPSVGAEEPE
jgi:hypothetical protein